MKATHVVVPIGYITNINNANVLIKTYFPPVAYIKPALRKHKPIKKLQKYDNRN